MGTGQIGSQRLIPPPTPTNHQLPITNYQSTREQHFSQVVMDNNQNLRLLADGMLGRLAKWLRLLGYDTAYDNHADDAELARRARAEGRVLLTRDRELSRRRGLRTLLIQSEVLEEQVQEVQNALGPHPTRPSPAAPCATPRSSPSPAAKSPISCPPTS